MQISVGCRLLLLTVLVRATRDLHVDVVLYFVNCIIAMGNTHRPGALT